MTALEAFLPYDVLDLRGGAPLRAEVRQRLRASLPDWVEFCVDTQAVANYTMMSTGPAINDPTKINYTDRQRVDFHIMRLAALHANQLLLFPDSANPSPRDLLQATITEGTLWDRLDRTEFKLWDKLDGTVSEMIKARRMRSQEDELLVVTAVRLLLLEQNAEISKGIPAFIHDQALGPRNDVYQAAQATMDSAAEARFAPELVPNAFAKLTRSRLLSMHKGKPWSKEQFQQDIHDAVKMRGNTSVLAGLKKWLFYPQNLKGKVQEKTTDKNWDRETAVFELELDDLLNFLQWEKEKDKITDPLKELVRKDPTTNESLFRQYYLLLSQNPDITSLK